MSSETAGSGNTTDYAAHYRRVRPVYEALGELETGGLCLGSTDFVGWYNTRRADGDWDGEGRGWALGREWEQFRKDLDRVAYATTNYAPTDWFVDAWDSYRWTEDNSREWSQDDTPLPGYGDLRAYAPFADVDLVDEQKHRRPEDGGPREIVEPALEEYIGHFARLAGGREHVFALDSVGGAYIMIAPTATLPITEQFDADARRLLYEDMMDRLNGWLKDVTEQVIATVPASEGTFEPDLLNNKNRLYKAPMSIHSSLEGVVTPLATRSPSYEYTPLSETTDADVEAARQWANQFTSDHTDAVEAVVTSLWDDYDGDWETRLARCLADLRAEENDDTNDTLPSADDGAATDTGTAGREEVLRAVENLDSEKVVRDFCDEFGTAGRDPPRFRPSYRTSDSGTSCFVNSEGKIVDLDDEHSAVGPVSYVARERLSSVGRTDTATGQDWWRAVEILRREGYDIPRDTSGEISDYYAYGLPSHVDGDPYEDTAALLRACLAAQDAHDDLANADPPYAALAELAEQTGLDFSDPDEQILGEVTYNVARRMFDDLSADDVS